MRKERIVIAVLSLVIIAGVIFYAQDSYMKNYGNVIEEYKTDSENMTSVEKLNNNMLFEATDGFVVDGKKTRGLVLENLELNDYKMNVLIDTPNGILYESPVISPGERISNVELSDQLAGGAVHDGRVIYQFLDDDNKVINRMVVFVKIMSV